MAASGQPPHGRRGVGCGCISVADKNGFIGKRICIRRTQSAHHIVVRYRKGGNRLGKLLLPENPGAVADKDGTVGSSVDGCQKGVLGAVAAYGHRAGHGAVGNGQHRGNLAAVNPAYRQAGVLRQQIHRLLIQGKQSGNPVIGIGLPGGKGGFPRFRAADQGPGNARIRRFIIHIEKIGFVKNRGGDVGLGLDRHLIRGPVRIIPAKQVIGIMKGALLRAVAMPDGQQGAVFFAAQHQGVLLCGKRQRRRDRLHRRLRRLPALLRAGAKRKYKDQG